MEGGTVRKARGRRPTLLSLNEDIVMLAVDLLPSGPLPLWTKQPFAVARDGDVVASI